jgi:PAS domain S-box-containing protein
MIVLDMRTVIFLCVISYLVCTLFVARLWHQNRRRFPGMGFWTLNFALQSAALFLIVFRGAIPDWMSIVLANTLMLAGAILNYMGLERFVGKPGAQLHNYVLLVLHTVAFVFLTYIHPDLYLRTVIISVSLLIVGFQSLWLLWRRVNPAMRPLTFGVGMVFAGYCAVSIVRIVGYFVGDHAETDFFQSGAFQALVLVSYQTLLILLTYSLVLMVNRRLIMEIGTQEEKFAKAFHSAPYAITLTRLPDGTIVDVNETFGSVMGYDRAEVIGKKTMDLHIWTREEDRAAVLEALSTKGKVQGMELCFRKRNGETVIGLLSAEIILIDGEQRVLSCIGDITERKQADQKLEHAKERLELALAASNGMVFDLDLRNDNLFVYGSPNWGGPGSGATVRLAQALDNAHPEDRPQLQRLVEELRDGSRGDGELEYRLRATSGEWIWRHLRLSAAERDLATLRPLRLIGTSMDITEVKRGEQALVAARDEAERANRAKSQFLASMSHELRTPMNSILGFTQVLETALKPKLDRNQEEMFGFVRKAGWHLLELINEVLDLEKVESGGMTLSMEPVGLPSALRECIDFIRPAAAARQIGVSLDEASCAGLAAFADRTRLRQAVLNLLSNAVKYNVTQGRVEVSCAPAGGERVRISVKDSGPGLTPEQQAHLYQPFNRLGREGSAEEGTGVGLALTRRLVELMGGRTGVESEAGKGSTFWLEFAAQRAGTVPDVR